MSAARASTGQQECPQGAANREAIEGLRHMARYQEEDIQRLYQMSARLPNWAAAAGGLLTFLLGCAITALYNCEDHRIAMAASPDKAPAAVTRAKGGS